MLFVESAITNIVTLQNSDLLLDKFNVNQWEICTSIITFFHGKKVKRKIILINSGAQVLQKYRTHLKIVVAILVTLSKFLTEDKKI
jgi:hypothetical protein